MVKKQIIGFVLTVLAISSLSIFLWYKSDFDLGGYTFTIEMFYCLVGICIFCVFWSIGAFIKQEKERAYWSIVWCITSIIVCSLSWWEFILSRNPTADSWSGLAQSCIYYLTGIPLSQIAVLLAVLGQRISSEVKNKTASRFMLLCLVFTSVGILPYILLPIFVFFSEGGTKFGLIGLSANIVPLLITIPLLLLILKKDRE
jgi:hypothetical protein